MALATCAAPTTGIEARRGVITHRLNDGLRGVVINPRKAVRPRLAPISHINTRVVVPPMPAEDAPKTANRLNPIFKIDGKRHSMVTQYLLLTVPVKILEQAVLNLNDRYDEIVRHQACYCRNFENQKLLLPPSPLGRPAGF